jgi:Undecaprenyl-phosphate galactose phosphotransferase WbaP
MSGALGTNRRRIREVAAPGGSAVRPALDLENTPARLLHHVARTALPAAGDAVMIGAAVTIAYVTWAAPVHGQSASMYLDLAPLVGLFLAGYARAGLYPGTGVGPVEMLRRCSYVTTFGFLTLAAFSFALKVPHQYSRATFLIAFVLSLVFVPLGRQWLTHVAGRWYWWAEPVVVIGTGSPAARAIRSLRQAGHLGYRPAAVIAADKVPDPGADLEGVPIVGSLDRLPTLSARGIRVGFLEPQFQTRDLVDRLQRTFLHLIVLREFDDLPVEGLQVRNLGTSIGIEYTNNLLRPRNQTAKRVLDLLLGGSALVLAAPLIGGVTLAVRLIDGAPALFRQRRVGFGGRLLNIPKIRTMCRDAETRLEGHFAANPSLRDEWRAHYKLRDDPRLIPGVGRMLRRFSIDELPQLWKVVTGEMSLVGPRPFPDYHLAGFTPAFRELRQRVRPGITGWWQISTRSEGNTDDQEALDTYYIRNWSVWFDFYVLGRTLLTVISGRGAY